MFRGTPTSESAMEVIAKMKSTFSRFELPNEVVSDNEPECMSK